jgi:hypothetical protein
VKEANDSQSYPIGDVFSVVTPKIGSELENGLDVSSYGQKPYKQFSPFTYSPDFKIPVPGQKDVFACSVESIWQGLKIIEGATDLGMFSEKPQKRKGPVQGHLLDEGVVGIVEAREDIYKPSYTYYVDNFVDGNVKEMVLEKALKKGVSFYDVEPNLDIRKSSPLAHSVFLKMFFEDYLGKRLQGTKDVVDTQYKSQESEHETLAEPIARALELFKNASDVDKRLIKFLLSNAKIDDPFHQRYYDHLLKEL